MTIEDGDVDAGAARLSPLRRRHGYDLYYLNVMAGPKRTGVSTTTRRMSGCSGV